MISSVESCLHLGRSRLRQWASDPRVRRTVSALACGAGGFLLSAASILDFPQPFAPGLISALSGWRGLAAALGSMLGYHRFWGETGNLCMVWSGLSFFCTLILGRRRAVQQAPLLLPAALSFCIAGVGLGFQIFFAESPPVPLYLLNIALGFVSSLLFLRASEPQNAPARWFAQGIWVLALAQVVPFPHLGLGFLAGGAAAAAGSIPAAGIAGLALDLAEVTPVSMTAVLLLSSLTQMIPGWHSLRYLAPGGVYLALAALTGQPDLLPLPGLVLGGVIAMFLPDPVDTTRRRGPTGIAQVHLEWMAGVLSQTQQLLLEVRDPPLDEQALLARARERACGSCPNRKTCQAGDRIPPDILHQYLPDGAALEFFCRKPGRMLLELRRSQDQLKQLHADRLRRQEYRQAVIQQYQFLSEFLRRQADLLPRSSRLLRQRYRPEVTVRSRSRYRENGDRCLHFSGPQCCCFVLLCDGMGTGLPAARESADAVAGLQQMLQAGFPPEYALRSLNSLCCLRGQAGAVTADLAQLHLDTGQVTIYKWGAAPSYVLRNCGAEKIGTAEPPPGLNLTEARETVDRLSLRRGEVLILFSDGVDGESALRRAGVSPEVPPGELAEYLLERASSDGSDDATAAVIRLIPLNLST